MAGQLTSLTNSFTEFKNTIEGNFVKVSSDVVILKSEIDKHTQQIQEIQENPGASSGNTGGGGDVSNFVENATGRKAKKETQGWTSPYKRTTLVISGFKYDSKGDDAEKIVTELLKDFGGITGVKSLGELCSNCKVFFKDSDAMWNVLNP